jgi:5-carboxymethyl-2-hydroxymuconate isomerase
MPISKLEYTSNIEISEEQITSFFKTLHTEMVKLIVTDLKTCKAYSTQLDKYCIADNADKVGFILLTIQILPGRDQKAKVNLKNRSGTLLLNLLKNSESIGQHQVRVIVTEAIQELYFMETYP